MATIRELEVALRNADAAGDVDAARKLAAALVRERQAQVGRIPTAANPADERITANVAPPVAPTIGDRVVGAGEAALSTVTGLTGGAAGMIGGTVKGIAQQVLSGEFGTPEAAQLVEQAAAEGARALTYAPRTAQGQDQAEAVGGVMQQLIPIAGLGGEAAALSEAARLSKPVAAVAARAAAEPVTEAVSRVTAPLREAFGGGPTPKAAGGQGSVGAAGTDLAAMRVARANELPVPMGDQMTVGMRTRDMAAQQFEHETAKNPTAGAPIRERMADLNAAAAHNLDAFFDATDARAADLQGVGVAVDQSLRSLAAEGKKKIRAAYNAADKAGELSAPADLSPVADYLNANRASREPGGIMEKVARQLDVMGVGEGSLQDGTIAISPMNLKQAETLRKFINKFAKDTDPNDIRVASDLKRAIDTATEGVGGNLYKAARAARADYAAKFENNGLVSQILGLKKGTTDRAIAIEHTLDRAVLSPSTPLASTQHLGQLLKRTPEGQQAWREIQGGVIQHLRDAALKNVARNERGDPVFSPAGYDRALSTLDKSGKLEYVFGKRGAEQLRTLGDVSKDLFVAVPGSVNHSGTSAALLAAFDMMLSASSGTALPIASGLRLAAKGIRDAKLKARVTRALNPSN